MAITGIRRGEGKTNAVVSGCSASGTSNSIPPQTSLQAILDQTNIIRTRSGKEIVRDFETDVATVRNNENGVSSRKRHCRQQPSPRSAKKQRHKVPMRASSGRRRGALFRVEEEGSREVSSGNRSILSWLINSGTVLPDARLYYVDMSCTKVLNKGEISDGGILCYCCEKLVTVSEFEIHAGSGWLNDPYRNIFVGDGINLLQCQIAAQQQDESARCNYHIIEDENISDHNDDTCGTCGDGGVLICCDGCPSTYHQSCMDIKVLPQGDWICPRCKCKFCREYKSTPAGELLTCLCFFFCSSPAL